MIQRQSTDESFSSDIWMGQNTLHGLIKRRQRGQGLPLMWQGSARGQDLQPRTQEQDPTSNVPVSENSTSMCPLNEVSMCPEDVWVLWQTWRLMGRKRHPFQLRGTVFSPNVSGSWCQRKGTTESENTQDTIAESPHKMMYLSWVLKKHQKQTNKYKGTLRKSPVVVSDFSLAFHLSSSFSLDLLFVTLPSGLVLWDYTSVDSNGECLLLSSTPSPPYDYTIGQPLSHVCLYWEACSLWEFLNSFMGHICGLNQPP